MTYDVSTWYLSVVPILLAAVISILANTKMNGVVRALNGMIQSHGDLQPVKEAINFNKRMAMVYMVVWFGQIAALVSFVALQGISFGAAIGHFFAFGVLTLPFGLWSKSVEKRFKALKVTSGDPALNLTFQRWLVEWKKPGFAVRD